MSIPGILVMTGAKGAKCVSRINGERIGKVEWGSKVGAVQAVQIVERMGLKIVCPLEAPNADDSISTGSHVLAIVTERLEVLVYSLPDLELLQILKLPTGPFS